MKPFVKWVGGKTQLLAEIRKLYPNKFNSYIEPFVGGGAVLFDILSKYSDLENVIINDINFNLINTYNVIRDNLFELIDCLSWYEKRYYESENKKLEYESLRYRYNYGCMSAIENSALFIFLNKTCYNGLYRVNKSGFFNSPMGDYKHPLICDRENLIAVSKALQGVKTLSNEYTDIITYVKDGVFIYFDPPYRPISKTSNFTAYNKSKFNDESQKKLAEFVRECIEKGAKVVLSNSDSEDGFFDELYSFMNIKRVQANRMINCDSKKRNKISELLIWN